MPEADVAHHGVVDGLMHCAGIIWPFARLANLDYDAIDRVIQVTFNGTIHVVKALMPRLLGRPVRVFVIQPGAVATRIAGNSGESIAVTSDAEDEGVDALAADEAARVLLDGIEGDDFRFIVGGDAHLIDVLRRASPRRATHFIQKGMAALLGLTESSQ